MEPRASSTNPNGSLRGHTGNLLPADADLFVPAPLEIGTVLSVSTNCRTSDRAPTTTERLNRFVAVALAPGFLCFAALLLAKLVGSRPLWEATFAFGFPFGVPAGLFAGMVVWKRSLFRRVISYVGSEGYAVFACEKDRRRLVRKTIARFADAETLEPSLTDVFVNSQYSWTEYEFVWRDEKRRIVHELKGSFNKRIPNAPGPRFALACAAMRAWNEYYSARFVERARKEGSFRFRTSFHPTVDAIRVSPSCLEFEERGRTTRWDVADVRDITFAGDFVTIRRQDARYGWLATTGVRTFRRSEIENASAFAEILRACGYRCWLDHCPDPLESPWSRLFGQVVGWLARWRGGSRAR